MVLKSQVGRFDGELKVIAFNQGDTVSTLLDKADIVLREGEAINNNNGEVIGANSTAVDNETYYIVGNYKQGCEQEEQQQ